MNKYIYISSDEDDFKTALCDLEIKEIQPEEESYPEYGKTPAGNYILPPLTPAEENTVTIRKALDASYNNNNNNNNDNNNIITKAINEFIQRLDKEFPKLNLMDKNTNFTFAIHIGGGRNYKEDTDRLENARENKRFHFQTVSRQDHYPEDYWIKGRDGKWRLSFINESFDPSTGKVTYNINLLKKFYRQVQILLSTTPQDKIEEQFANRNFWITAIWNGEPPESFDAAFSAAEKDILSKNEQLKEFFETILDKKTNLALKLDKIHIIISQIMRIFNPQETECIPPYAPVKISHFPKRTTIDCFLFLFILLIVIPFCFPIFPREAEYETVTEIRISVPDMEKTSNGQSNNSKDKQPQSSEAEKGKENDPSLSKRIEELFPCFAKIMLLFSGNDKNAGDSVSEKNRMAPMIGYVKQLLPEPENDKGMNGNSYFLKEEKKAAPIQYFNMFLRFCLYALGGVLCFVVYLKFMQMHSREEKMLNQEQAFTNLCRITWKLNSMDKQAVIKHFAQSSIRLFFNGEDSE